MNQIAGRLPSGQKFLLCKNYTAILRYQIRNLENSARSPRKSGFPKIIAYGVTGTSILIGGGLLYAKYNENFRKQIIDTIPGSTAVINLVAPESNKSTSTINQGTKRNSPFFNTENKATDPTKLPSYTPPSKLTTYKPATVSNTITPEANKSSPESNKSAKNDEPKQVDKTANDEPIHFKKYNINDLEKEVVEAANVAILGFNNSIRIMKDYEGHVANMIEKSVHNDDSDIWFRIKEISERKNQMLESVEKKGEEAMEKIEQLELLLKDPKSNIDADLRHKVEENIKNSLNDLVYSKALFVQARSASDNTEKYSQKVEESRRHLSKELGLLFPSVIIEDETVANAQDYDLFVLYTSQLLHLYQKEIKKLEILGKAKIEKAIELIKSGSSEFSQQLVDIEVDKIKREISQELVKKELKLKSEFEKELRLRLRTQEEVHADHLNEIIELKNKELERKLMQISNEKIENMQLKYNQQLVRIIGRMKGLDDALKEKAHSEKQARHSQLLWNACQSLILALKSTSDNTIPWENQLKPLHNEVLAISKAAAEGDPLVNAVVASIPDEAIKRGVYSEIALKDRFLYVEKVAYRLANLPEGYVSLPKLFLSFVQSLLLIRPANPAKNDEILNEPVNVSSLNNYDVLDRAKYWVERGDYEQCLKYMNLLKGASRAIVDEWMKEARLFLETQQAANLLLTHAVYSNLIYLNNSS